MTDARTAPTPDGRAAVGQLLLVSAVQVLAIATWFAASAAAPALREQWEIGRVGEAMLTIGVQLGFVAGALASAVTNLPDRVHPPRLMGLGALVAAAATFATATLVDGVVWAVVLRLVTGAALALVYPVGMKVVVSWFADRRGLAVSIMVGALTLGSLLPQLIAGSLGSAWREALVVSASLALVAAMLQRWIVVGPLVTRSEGFQPAAALDVWRQRAPRLANLGYLGHMWELYAVWAWAPTFLAASAARRRRPRCHGRRSGWSRSSRSGSAARWGAWSPAGPGTGSVGHAPRPARWCSAVAAACSRRWRSGVPPGWSS